jgi:pSer/pThr/pTyr-binding forkhead associated (FHA) protein
MFDLFRKGEQTAPDVKSIRSGLLQFIKTQMAKAEGGEGGAIKSMHLYLTCAEGERHLFEPAVYQDEEGRFKEEVQKIADDFALNLPQQWDLEITFAAEPPAEAIRAPQVAAALFIRSSTKAVQKKATAYIRVLNGEAENEVYALTSESGKINIGREKRVQTRDNFFRVNTIAFPAESVAESNKYISRQHAHIEWDNNTGTFLLFADEGGVPPRNKIKIRSVQNEDPVKLQSTKLGYSLQEGDQIILGETALLEFSYSPS